MRQVDLQGGDRAGGRRSPPHLVNQLVGGHQLVGAQGEAGEHGALAGTTEGQRPAFRHDLKGAQQAQLEPVHQHPLHAREYSSKPDPGAVQGGRRTMTPANNEPRRPATQTERGRTMSKINHGFSHGSTANYGFSHG